MFRFFAGRRATYPKKMRSEANISRITTPSPGHFKRHTQVFLLSTQGTGGAVSLTMCYPHDYRPRPG